MAWNRDPRVWMHKIASLSWRFSVLALPWQTRWFLEAPFVNGLPWEQGRISIYASWIPMLITISVVFFLQRLECWFFILSFRRALEEKSLFRLIGRFLPPKMDCRASSDSVQNDRNGSDPTYFIYFLIIIGFVLSIGSVISTIFFRATAVWLMQILVLAGFVWALRSLSVSRRQVIFWMALSLVPHLLLGAEQWISQRVIGTRWLGIASQDPMTHGVSVVETSVSRILRVHGGFPHPNIFAGWLTVAIMAVTTSLKKEHARWMRIGGMFFLAFSSVMLALTFSRAAWLAWIFGMLLMLVTKRRSATYTKSAFFVSGLTFLLAITATASLVFSRVQGETLLEQKSLTERQTSIADGWRVFRHRPLRGVGPGNFVIQNAKDGRSPNPPHFLPLLVLSEIGIAGVLGLAIFGFLFFRGKKGWLWMQVPLVLIFAILGFFDHYFWSFWAGQSLLFLGFILVKSP